MTATFDARAARALARAGVGTIIAATGVVSAIAA